MNIPNKKDERLDFFAEKYERALEVNAPHIARFIKHYGQYNGSRQIDGSFVEAKVVRNITREIIEGQVDSRVPYPKVSSQCVDDKHVKNARSIERLCDYYSKKLDFEKLNDVGERQTYVFGSSIWLAEFDNSIVEGNKVGAVTVRVVHPKFFTPQPGIEDIKDMDYCFIDIPLPREEIERRYNVEIEENEGETFTGDLDYMPEETTTDETVLLHICFYKDENRNVCEYIWTDNIEILNINDYYARKVRRCKNCGRRAELCEDEPCESPEYEDVSAEEETLQKDITDREGKIIIPAMTQVYKDGVPQFDEITETIRDELGRTVVKNVNGFQMPLTRTVSVPKMAPTVLPYYKPSRFPIVIRQNTSAIDGDWCGVSDCDIIRDQQQTVNKYESRALEKSMKSGTVVALPKGATIDSVDNSVYDKAVRLEPNQSVNQFGVINTEVGIGQDMTQADRVYEAAKKISGVTSSFVGQADNTAKSGKAKQIQVQQAAGRLESKRIMKLSAIAELYRIIFELELAYRDEVVMLCDEDDLGGSCMIHFNRYSFFKFDTNTGKWMIDSDYLFEADYSGTPEDQREAMWELNMINYEKGMFGDPMRSETRLRYWLKQERAGYPYAYEEVAYYRRLVKEEMEAMAAQQGHEFENKSSMNVK